MKLLFAFCHAFICMTIHRNLKMAHIGANEHLVKCKICDEKMNEGVKEIKNKILTSWYFNTEWYSLPVFILIFLVGGLHRLITGRKGNFEQPAEHCPLPIPPSDLF